jgi:dolichol kinase
MEQSSPATKPETKKKSGKREAGWIVFVTVSAAVFWALQAHMEGSDMSAFVSLFVIAWPASFAAAVGPHVVHHLRSPAWQE